MPKKKTPPTVVNDVGGFTFDKKGNVKIQQDSAAFNVVMNGLTTALMGSGAGDFFSKEGGALNSAATLFKNNRWYLVSNFRQLISESYIEHGILQTVVDVPVDDGFRGGVEIHTKELEPEEIEELSAWIEEEDDLGKIAQTAKWNRLFGGAGTVINVDQDPTKPLDLNKKINRMELYAADLWELFWNRQNIDEDPMMALEPAGKNRPDVEFFDFYGHKIHKSRVMKQKGIEAPSLIRPRMRGWGVSVMEVLVNSINQYLKTNNLIFEVLDEFKVDYYKIKDYAAAMLNPKAYEATTRRIQFANRQKNFQHAVVMDASDEWSQRQLTFAGLAEIFAAIRMQIASDLRMPLSKVFGISSQGFGSGQDDIENYNGMVESQVRQKVKFQIVKVVKLRCLMKFGFIPEDLKVSFLPLRILGAEQEENVKTQKFSRILQARQAGEITREEFRDAVNKSKLMDIQLDNSGSVLKELEKEKEASDAKNAPNAPGGKAPESKTKAPTAKE